MHRSYLFVPGHDAELVSEAFGAGADVVMLDLHEAVPASRKSRARHLVVEALVEHEACVRVNAVRTAACEADLDAAGALAVAVEIPSVQSADDAEWVAARAPGTPLICAIDRARGVLAATDIACVEGVRTLTLDGAGLRRDLHLADGHLPTLYVRSRLVVVCGAAGLEPPIDGAYPVAHDGTGLREEARAARSLGFFGKAAIHPRQLPIIHEVFAPTDAELVWAREVVDAFAGTRGAALRLPSGELVDVPVAQRAQRILELADGLRSS